MGKTGEISEIVDSVLKVLVAGGVVSVGLFAPNAVQALDKPLKYYFKKMDSRQREREFRKALTYMRAKKLVTGSYEHGLQVTSKGKKRVEKAILEDLFIEMPEKWDGRWRLVFFDIPEEKKSGRDALTRQIKKLGFRQLQKSVWIHPYACRKEIEIVSTQHNIDRYITYVETTFIDKQEKLEKQFNLKT